ncbi:hypothetical protein QQ045_000487 [Rhodiola kirilowii]
MPPCFQFNQAFFFFSHMYLCIYLTGILESHRIDLYIESACSHKSIRLLLALHVHRRPLAPSLNHKDQASHSHRRPLAPEDQKNRDSSTFARKAKNKGKTDDGTKFIFHGKENVGKLVPSIKHGNGRGVVDKSNRMKLTEVRNVHELLAQKDMRREPVITSKLRP